ncbi:MAG TPA: hypothetical protein VLB50_10085, partial [Ignavibacteriaceae bacterium]|nr:hypothetical protein [Ignavibacteriaceae bacterium]
MNKLQTTIIVLLLASINLFGQYLSNLSVKENDPIYTTYNAALSRSQYIINEGYQFIWYDQQKGMNFETKQAGNLGLIFRKDDVVISKLQQFYKKPIITASYSDLVKFYYYPFKEVKVEEYFLVYSSAIAIRQIKITNESPFDLTIDVYPFIQFEQIRSKNISVINDGSGVTFQHREFPDGWMKEHNIPFRSDIKDILFLDTKPESFGTYNEFEKVRDTSSA